ncbi:hypothetical protein PHYSODRAFT_319793 [Phytophthora sojae]|uniref:DUF4038 domain-containing protein n=1 Tax=Phytophthora sojae (strain P6497) TaxID=1094619 RepID=G5ADV4_PHYSP|nr:hypothetical protein PHYSODRAFT_319793 [Phytophthora sojae]EGZ06356.1 hypothetical protein PHYSODRAFT_319793 [Phytophthora sojae]|eukprot:XP_009538253.1 hypothetical protein PHYSODRAFT_319793 [Phytophthora sojae]
MKVLTAIAGAASLASFALAEPSWHNLTITAPQYGRYLYRTESEEPFFWKADTAWELTHRLNKTSIDFYLKTRAEQGYNVVLSVVLSAYNGTTRPNFYGDLPFNNGDTTQFNESYFELIDWTVDLAASYGILMALVPAWGNWISGAWHGTKESLFNDSTAYEWGKYVGERYPGLPKILGGDTNCFWVRNTTAAMISYAESPTVDPATLLGPVEDTTHLWLSMRSGVKDAESAQGYEPVILFHPTAGNIDRPVQTPEAYGHLQFPKEEDRVSIDAVQSGHATPEALGGFTPYKTWDSTKNYELIAAMRDGFTGPVLDLENHYEGAHDNLDASVAMIWNASQVRTGLYNNVYAGAAGFTYGANSVWQMYEPAVNLLRESDYYSPSSGENASSSWRKDLFFEAGQQAQYVTKPLQNLSVAQLEQLEPARQLLASPSGYTDVAVNAFGSTRFISVLASETRDRFYVYTGHGDSFSLELGNGSERSGTARWFSPRDGEFHSDSTVNVPANATHVDFTPPSGGTVDDDWLLVLEF